MLADVTNGELEGEEAAEPALVGVEEVEEGAVEMRAVSEGKSESPMQRCVTISNRCSLCSRSVSASDKSRAVEVGVNGEELVEKEDELSAEALVVMDEDEAEVEAVGDARAEREGGSDEGCD